MAARRPLSSSFGRLFDCEPRLSKAVRHDHELFARALMDSGPFEPIATIRTGDNSMDGNYNSMTCDNYSSMNNRSDGNRLARRRSAGLARADPLPKPGGRPKLECPRVRC
jgi:hypothetical protein